MTIAKTRRTRRGDARRSNSVGIWLVGGATLLVLLVVAFVIWNQRPAPVDPGAYAAYDPSWLAGRTLGDPNAPVTVQVWDDFL